MHVYIYVHICVWSKAISLQVIPQEALSGSGVQGSDSHELLAATDSFQYFFILHLSHDLTFHFPEPGWWFWKQSTKPFQMLDKLQNSWLRCQIGRWSCLKCLTSWDSFNFSLWAFINFSSKITNWPIVLKQGDTAGTLRNAVWFIQNCLLIRGCLKWRSSDLTTSYRS